VIAEANKLGLPADEFYCMEGKKIKAFVYKKYLWNKKIKNFKCNIIISFEKYRNSDGSRKRIRIEGRYPPLQNNHFGSRRETDR
jgi:hypothetical protein